GGAYLGGHRRVPGGRRRTVARAGRCGLHRAVARDAPGPRARARGRARTAAHGRCFATTADVASERRTMVAPGVQPAPADPAADGAAGPGRVLAGRGRTVGGAAAPAGHPPGHPLVLRTAVSRLLRVGGRGRGAGAPVRPVRDRANHVSMLDWAFVSYFLPW